MIDPTPSEHRLHLLTKLTLDGPQPIERTFALDYVFPDISFAHWCASNFIDWKIEKLVPPDGVGFLRRENGPEIEFIRFTLIPDEDL